MGKEQPKNLLVVGTLANVLSGTVDSEEYSVSKNEKKISIGGGQNIVWLILSVLERKSLKKN